jgi:hypothetical protein
LLLVVDDLSSFLLRGRSCYDVDTGIIVRPIA